MFKKMKTKFTKKMMAYGLVAVLGVGAITGIGVSMQDANKDTGAYSVQKFKTKYFVTKESLNLRSTTSTRGKVLKVIPKNTKLASTAKYGTWYKTTYKGTVGYVSGSYLKPYVAPKPTPSPKPTTGYDTPKKMTLAQTKTHIKGKLSYNQRTKYYAYDVTGRGDVWVALTTNSSGPVALSVRPDFFDSITVNKSEYIEFFGKSDYDILQKQVAKGKIALRASVETLVGKNKKLADRVYNEVFVASKSGKDKTLTFGGKKIKIIEYQGTVIVSY